MTQEQLQSRSILLGVANIRRNNDNVAQIEQKTKNGFAKSSLTNFR